MLAWTKVTRPLELSGLAATNYSPVFAVRVVRQLFACKIPELELGFCCGGVGEDVPFDSGCAALVRT